MATETEEKSKGKAEDEPKLIPVYNVNDGLVGRNGGPYLDEEEAKEQERRNARAEGREPNYSNLAKAPSPGVQLVTAPQLLRVSVGRLGVGQLDGTISAPVYGYVPNPVTVEANAVNAQEEALKQNAKVDPRSNVETPKGVDKPKNNF